MLMKFKKFLDYDLGIVLCENGRQLKLHTPIQILRENTELHHEWLDIYDGVDFRWTTIENKGIRFYRYL